MISSVFILKSNNFKILRIIFQEHLTLEKFLKPDVINDILKKFQVTPKLGKIKPRKEAMIKVC